MKRTIIIVLSIIIISIGVIIAIAIYGQNKKNGINIEETKVADEEILDDCTDEYEELQIGMLEASSNEEKISPNCFMTLKVTYKQCGHQTNEYTKVPDELVNKTKEELQEKYKDWNIEKFSDTDIVLTKEEEGNCGEHFLVKDTDGKIVIYKILESGEQEKYDVTNISTEYLSDTDREQLKNGIKVTSRQALNQLIEDYE